MKQYFDNKAELVEYVADLLETSRLNSRLTMTITPEASGDYSVLIAIDTSSEDTELRLAKFFSETQVNI